MERGLLMYRSSHATWENDCMHTTADGADQIAWGLSHSEQDDKVTVEGYKYKASSHLLHAHIINSIHYI